MLMVLMMMIAIRIRMMLFDETDDKAHEDGHDDKSYSLN